MRRPGGCSSQSPSMESKPRQKRKETQRCLRGPLPAKGVCARGVRARLQVCRGACPHGALRKEPKDAGPSEAEAAAALEGSPASVFLPHCPPLAKQPSPTAPSSTTTREAPPLESSSTARSSARAATELGGALESSSTARSSARATVGEAAAALWEPPVCARTAPGRFYLTALDQTCSQPQPW